ncbi:uncharacterized protein LOC124261336 [Haliotis rubra]|uniref:uncharacterized protein LOC124261336 n=1 Tax=Haliotis rubra TaxID=36100 RepID=UPI001EE50C35|nr:uncharacterized protein LOC124261336 [Haliotis rubra]
MSRYTGFVWVRPDSRYVVTCFPGCSPVAGYSGVVNVTHTTLTIDSVGMADAGTWSIMDATTVGAVPVQSCQLTVANLPQCNISSDADLATLQPNTTLTLTVDIRGYYCSRGASVGLTTGNVTEMLIDHNASDTSDVVTSRTFSVTPVRLGDVTVSFTCDVRRWDLNCDGVDNLVGACSPRLSSGCVERDSFFVVSDQRCAIGFSFSSVMSDQRADKPFV